ncbi:DNA cytosine methyltransferase [Patescibacteria group bacterium]|nr:DNA cytosine methyltransferase [Patescibacteria group bacterium]
MSMKKLKAVDFFCSGGGMTCGLRQAGIDVIAGIDNDPSCKDTYEGNNPGSEFLHEDVFDLKEQDLEKRLDLKKNDDNLILIGCSPCQYWSIIRTNKSKSTKSKNLLIEFNRFVDYFNPGYVLVENVPGILTRKDKSGLDNFIASLGQKGFKVHFGTVNMNQYGVPQSRRRFSLLATRLHSESIFPTPNLAYLPTVRDVLGAKNGFKKVHPGHRDMTAFYHSTANITEKNVLRLKKTPKSGGSWKDWANDKKLKRLSYSGNGFPDNYGRMSWDKPAPTITTKFVSISNGRFAHPEEDRGLSIREGATLQTFPKEYIFPSESIGLAAKIIGNAVPPLFAKSLGETIMNAHSNKKHGRRT